jgi:Trk K+ transport system NAD-binding subunit
MRKSKTTDTNPFLVCGLGNLGQYCVSVLKEFGVVVNAIEVQDIQNWEIPDLPDKLEKLIIGDCRQPKILEAAGIRQCRAILIVTSSEQVNIATAFAARSLNPDVRIVISSSQESLNESLSQQIGNFAAFESTQLPAKSIALFALGTETRGFFTLENYLLKVIRVEINSQHPWCNHRQICELNNPNRRVLTHISKGKSVPKAFYEWEPSTTIIDGDTIAYIETQKNHVFSPVVQHKKRRQRLWGKINLAFRLKNTQQKISQFWEEGTQTQRVAVVSSIVMASMLVCGTLLYKLQYHDISWQEAINAAVVLSIGGYDNFFGQLHLSFPIPWWLHIFSLCLTFAGTVFVGIIYAMLTERVLAARFQFKKRPPIPKSKHVVIIGLGRVGQGVATLLQEYQQPFVGIDAKELEAGVLPQIPIIIGTNKNLLAKANVATAKSIIAVTDDEIANLEIGLRSHAVNPKANIIIRTFDPRFSENVAQLLPYARVVGNYALSAEAFVAAAFGKNIHSLFRLNNQTTLVSEYIVKDGDGLQDKLMSEIVYGYGVVPVLHAKSKDEKAKLMPCDDVILEVGDRLVVLATIEGLQRIEKGIITPREWIVQLDKVIREEGFIRGALIIFRVCGVSMQVAEKLMHQLPDALPCLFYKHQAQRLINELSEVHVLAHVEKRTVNY